MEYFLTWIIIFIVKDTYSMGTGVFFPGVKQQERGINHSSLSSAEAKNEGHSTSTPLHTSTVRTGTALLF